MTLFTDVPSRYSRKPFDVDAVRVTERNLEDVAEWCGGEIRADEKSGRRRIIVPVKRPLSANQRIARVGSWVVFSIVPIGFKAYSDNAFRKTFEPVGGAWEETPDDNKLAQNDSISFSTSKDDNA
jgi:hypothetical protein